MSTRRPQATERPARGPRLQRTGPSRTSAQRADLPAIEKYLTRFPLPVQQALTNLRAAIRAAAPEATERMSYGLPAFAQDGPLVAYGATARHCAFYLMSGAILSSFPDVEAGYDCSKGTVRFSVDRPLPKALVRRLVKARIAENRALRDAKKPGATKKTGAKKKTGATKKAGATKKTSATKQPSPPPRRQSKGPTSSRGKTGSGTRL